jgi:integrase
MSSRRRGVVHAKGSRIQFTIYVKRRRFRPTLPILPTEANLQAAQQRVQQIYARIDAGTFDLLEEFPDYRLKHRYSLVWPSSPRTATCNQIFDRFLSYCEMRVAMNDLAFSTLTGYRRILDRTWRPRLGPRLFRVVIFSDLLEIAVRQGWVSKKTYNCGLTPLRCAFAFGYKDYLDAQNPAARLESLRMMTKDRRPIDPFTIEEAEEIISALHQAWGEATGNYDEFRFFTGLRQSELIALQLPYYDAANGTVLVRRALVLGVLKDRTKNHQDRLVMLCPRARLVLDRQLALREARPFDRTVKHPYIFFKDNGEPITELSYPYRRWRSVLERLTVRYREPYTARHCFVTWNLMVGKNFLWVADQHGHAPETMLTTYAQWQRGATEADIERIRCAMGLVPPDSQVSPPFRAPNESLSRVARLPRLRSWPQLRKRHTYSKQNSGSRRRGHPRVRFRDE